MERLPLDIQHSIFGVALCANRCPDLARNPVYKIGQKKFSAAPRLSMCDRYFYHAKSRNVRVIAKIVRGWTVKARAIAKGLAAVAEVISIWLMLILKRGLNLLADKRQRFTM